MKQNHKASIIIVLFLSTLGVFSQKNLEKKRQFVEKTKAKITTEKGSERVKFIKFPIGNSLVVRGSSLKEKSINFLEENKAVYGLQSVKNSLLFEKEELDSHGLNNLSFKQYYKGVPVYDGGLKFHYNSTGKLNSVNGNVFPFIKLNTTPDLNIAKATTIALRAVESQNINRSEKPLQAKNSELLVFKKGLVQGYIGATHLVYRIEVSNQADVREFLFIDAHDGSLVEQFTGTYHVVNRILYEENTSTTVWTEGDALPGTLDQWQQNEVEAAGHMYNFFKNAFGYESYDGNNAQMKTINNNPGISCPNATWNGSTANYCTGTASDDVVAHEWGHAYTQHTSNLIYAYQSGALNESYSDIWGETIDLLNEYEDEEENLSIKAEGNCRGSVRWKLGEDATAFGVAIRDMWSPTCKGDPGKTSDSEYNCSSSDNGGVHTNSGIPNHAYALLVDGGTYNGQSISGLGFTKAAHIFWRAQSVYLTRTSDFSAFADALEAAGADLIGINLQGLSTDSPATGLSGERITQADLDELSKVILAVELRISPSTCTFNTLLTATDPLCDASTNNPLFSEDWESGMGDWTVEQLPTDPSTWESRHWVISSSLPGGRAGSGMFGADPINGNCTTDLQNGIIRLQSPIITIPDISEGIFEMTFDHYISTESLWDGGNVKYRIVGNEEFILVPGSSFTSNPYNLTLNSTAGGNDNPMESQEAFSGGDETPNGLTGGSWGKSTIDLSSLGVVANSQIEFRWEMGTDGCIGDDGWYLDEIIIYNCSAVLALSKYDILLQDISVYPNPTTDTFTIRKLASLNLLKAELFDINGRKLKEADLSEMVISQDIDINELARGIYFVTVTSEDTKATVKLIKQ
jgi:bacillolysin